VGDFAMPSLGADMEAGTVLEWRVQPGDVVHRGDIVAVVDTEKSTIDVEVFEDGVVTELLVEAGCEVPVGTVLARIAEPGAEPSVAERAATDRLAPEPAGEVPAAAVAGAPMETTAAAVAGAPMGTTAAPVGRPRRQSRKKAEPARRPSPGRRSSPARRPSPVAHVRASPLARRRAAERGVALGDLEGSGPDGAVVAADVDRAEPPESHEPPSPTELRVDHQESLRRAVGALMARSKREIPHYYLATTIDLQNALSWLRTANDRRPVSERLLPAALLLKATALAARDVPALNGFFDEDFRPSGAVHLGVAVALRGGGLVAPAIHDADQLTLDELMAALRDLVGRARSGRLRGSEMADPTITVTNLGDQGVDEVHGVIYPPQVALVGFGKIDERPWASDGMLGVRPTVRATLAADHRASDGLVGARFLATLDRLLHSPEER
jgi:pyruvate dehydrogenase E2 component (dihydrolipoamide acetyltransferase)